MGMKDPVPTYTYYIIQIIQRHPDLAYLHATEKHIESPEEGQNTSADAFMSEGTENDFIRELWSAYGTNGRRLITAGGYTRETGMRVAQRKGDLIAYGRLFISNVSFFSLCATLALTVYLQLMRNLIFSLNFRIAWKMD